MEGRVEELAASVFTTSKDQKYPRRQIFQED